MKQIIAVLTFFFTFTFCINAQRPGAPKQFPVKQRLHLRNKPKKEGIRLHRYSLFRSNHRHKRIKNEMNLTEEEKQEKG